jgi:hypothetical protein
LDGIKILEYFRSGETGDLHKFSNIPRHHLAGMVLVLQKDGRAQTGYQESQSRSGHEAI